MFSLLIWSVYGIFAGAIAKAIVPGEENFGFFKTIALGITGSYFGGAAHYMLGMNQSIEPAGLFMGIAGAVLALVLYNRVVKS